MQTSDLTRETLRRLAELRPDGVRVLSLFVNLDPSEFATPQARITQAHSLLDEAGRRVDADEDLSHDQRRQLRADIDRLRAYFDGSDFSPRGAHGMAVFCAGSADLFEVIRLTRAPESSVTIDDSPVVEPLADLVDAGSWAVLLVNGKVGRLLVGSSDRLEEVESFRSQVEAPLMQSGGGSQARNDRADAKEHQDHLKRVAEVLFRRTKRAPLDRLLIGATRELHTAMESELHPYLRERLVGRIDVDVESSTPQQVQQAARPTIEEEDRRRERESLDRLRDGLGTGGRAAAGLEDVLGALNERRVEILLRDDGFRAPGVLCSSCGFVGPDTIDECPVDGGELERRDDVMESAVELAIGQSAQVIVPRHHDDLAGRGGIAAVLRF